MKIEVANKQGEEGNNKRPAQVQGDRSWSSITMGKDTSCTNVAMLGYNPTGGIEVVYRTNLQTGEDDCVPCFTSNVSWQSKDQRIRIKGYFAQ